MKKGKGRKTEKGLERKGKASHRKRNGVKEEGGGINGKGTTPFRRGRKERQGEM